LGFEKEIAKRLAWWKKIASAEATEGTEGAEPAKDGESDVHG